MGIHSVRGLLSRLELFDLDKASVSMSDDGDTVNELIIKEGRKRVSYRFSSPSRILAPTTLPETGWIVPLSLEAEYVRYLSKVMGSISMTGNKTEQTVSIRALDGSQDVELSIFDGESDSFNETIEIDHDQEASGVWEVAPFQRVLTRSLAANGDGPVTIELDSYRVVTFNLGILDAKVVPMAS